MRDIGQRVFLTVAALAAAAGVARADVTTEHSSSILVWPKVIADGTRDTVIEVTNTSNSLARAHCFYVNAALTNPALPEGPLNPRLWQEIDFDIVLTRQQPTFWIVSEGRNVDPSDPPCSAMNDSCVYAGFDPGKVPPVVPDFVGELKCVQVDDSGAPLSANSFIGDAKLVAVGPILVPGQPRGFGEVSSYNAIGILGRENNGDDTLVLGGGQCGVSKAICTSDDDCGDGAGPCVLEYNACPDTWILNHTADGAPDLILQEIEIGDSPTPIETELTIVPCTQNFETQRPTTVTLQFLTWNEFESQFSTSTSVTCWGNFRLGDIGAPAMTFAGQLMPDKLGTMYLQTRIRSAEGTPFGVLMVAEEFHTSKPSTIVDMMVEQQIVVIGSAAVNLHVEGERSTPDIITIPAEQLAP